jgi:putative chitinase
VVEADAVIDLLIRLGVNPTQARAFSDPLRAAMALHDISTPQRQAAFLAHCILESARLTRLEENLFYTTPERIRAVWPSRFKTATEAAPFARNPKALANRVYSGRNGNGDEASGDGWRYRGRGLFQLTGRANYLRAAQGIGRPYDKQPDLVAEPSDACLTAAWFWAHNGGNDRIDRGDFNGTTRMVNGPAMLHANERLALYQDAMGAMA